LGFENAGFEIVAAFDHDARHVATHKKNFPLCKTFQADAAKTTGTLVRKKASLGEREIDVLIGGPPCQGFSVGGSKDQNDPRNSLILEFARLVAELKPRSFVMENVVGILGAGHRQLMTRFASIIADAGYDAEHQGTALNATNLGVPQRRKRIFIIGVKSNLQLPSVPTECTLTTPTVWNAIGDLSVIEDCEELYSEDAFRGALGTPSDYAKTLRSRPSKDETGDRAAAMGKGLGGCAKTRHSRSVTERFKNTDPGERESISRFFRLDKQGVAPTLRAGTTAQNGSFMAPRPIHPVSPRVITVREAARLHSFPDWFAFDRTRWYGFMQVGNSVPPLVARHVAEALKTSL
jgi:DNA (cytosine-5)-methyltransferase 1